MDQGLKSRSLARTAKKNITQGTLHIHATYNNTKVLLTDKTGNAMAWSSSGSLGFSGAKKGTPFAAAKVGELVGDKAAIIGVKEVDVVIRGVGAGRESALRGFAGKGIDITKIADDTPVAHNGPRPPKPRRV
ncbi:30S ribosomal protein S11 [Candidatus Kaiserbacteria bacterium RIFCSPHIGHO2_02_FULL_55_25]|uniref:Small ribosomal subunit protein uS11 n=1 Tax=Candidatus Kaiserbacteria bacterium RIFCSPHIGHO2_02_FULL_55_25 TaxID=1798498 RepID=A0A1F6EAW1_9BACT|nr:MAG: 30S ribosomal protein S11 [Candidatus Kaiserbacteria bacterium RIFCSPHIGHO2_01_FULL_55_79]OGG70824.1 MAG: 30S ribosomal protein S11 [Candidatus Kaiserbacteria bacterium RIFCSPHIGHO2_02_FULL_55_25]OGG77111.1 MAG: 30S ribosomal protein S11 [Candidatus Kaiserbacteria bacterium RIFCSPHIGHO2_12_FULL_55_13]OGG84056.1 MAG: 30S ribosomal protein S11 [Candidatus Kaiserbacteria bacterium RIFCSPLOWO2_01_FULL_55_25]